MAKYRPQCPILAVARDMKTMRQMHLFRGLFPIVYDDKVADELPICNDGKVLIILINTRSFIYGICSEQITGLNLVEPNKISNSYQLD